MRVGVLRETAPGEQRVALVPDAARALIEQGHSVVVERGAGVGAGYADHQYILAGAQLASAPAEIFGECQVIVWVKPPYYNLWVKPPPQGSTFIGFQNPLRRRRDMHKLHAMGIRHIAFELVPTSEPSLDALSAMSHFAGEVAYHQARQLVTDPVEVLILGPGNAGLAAVRAAAADQAAGIAILGTRASQAGPAFAQGATEFLLDDGNQLLRYLDRTHPNIIVCAAIRRGDRAPSLLGPSELALLPAGAVVIDLAGQAGGNCTATILDQSASLPNGIMVMHRSNYPAQRPWQASAAYSRAMAAMIAHIQHPQPHSGAWPQPGDVDNDPESPASTLLDCCPRREEGKGLATKPGQEAPKASHLQQVTAGSDARKKALLAQLGQSSFPGTASRKYQGVIDAYHGETGYPLASATQAALHTAWQELLGTNLPAPYSDHELYDKRQPLILRKLAADRLFRCLSHPASDVAGVTVHPDEVLVTAYSSTLLLEEAIATLARPGGVILCPEGFYKSNSLHIEKFGLRIVSCPVAPGDEFRLDAATLDEWLTGIGRSADLCGVLFTLPGNPVVARHTVAELQQIARVLAKHQVPVICDMAFGELVDHQVPLAALTDGNSRLYDQVLTITGTSKGYNAFGPCKIGAACSGNADWLRRLRTRLTISFQRETTHLARAILEHTPDSYLATNRRLAQEQQLQSRAQLAAINTRAEMDVYQVLGDPHGMFVSVTLHRDLARRAGIRTSAELEDLMLAAAGIDTVGLERTGSPRLAVRLNVLAPRKAPGQERTRLSAPDSQKLTGELFDRLERLAQDLRGGLTHQAALSQRGLPPLSRTSLTVGVIRETAPAERRVALTPDDVAQLTNTGLRIVVECGAGASADYPDASYACAGATMVADASAVFDRCDIIAWVNPPAGGLRDTQTGQLIVGFQDPVERQQELAQLRTAGVNSLAFELVPPGRATSKIDALSRTGRIAGAVAFRQGIRLVAGSRPSKVLILGCGQAGLSAARAAKLLSPTIVGNRTEQASAAGASGRFVLNDASTEVLLTEIARAKPDLILCAAARRGSPAPRLLDEKALALLRPGAVVVDLVAKAGGNCTVTQAESTIRLNNDVIVTHQSNYSAMRPRMASRAYGRAAAAMISWIASGRSYQEFVVRN